MRMASAPPRCAGCSASYPPGILRRRRSLPHRVRPARPHAPRPSKNDLRWCGPLDALRHMVAGVAVGLDLGGAGHAETCSRRAAAARAPTAPPRRRKRCIHLVELSTRPVGAPPERREAEHEAGTARPPTPPSIGRAASPGFAARRNSESAPRDGRTGLRGALPWPARRRERDLDGAFAKARGFNSADRDRGARGVRPARSDRTGGVSAACARDSRPRTRPRCVSSPSARSRVFSARLSSRGPPLEGDLERERSNSSLVESARRDRRHTCRHVLRARDARTEPNATSRARI